MSDLKHESARAHVTGRAAYADELPMPQGTLSLYPVQSPHAHARILAMDCADAEHMPGVGRVLTAKDVPGENDTGPILHDEPLFPVDFVHYHGQAVAWVLADSEELAQRAAQHVRVDYEVLPACLSIPQALEQGSFHLPPSCIVRGDVQATLDGAPVQLRGEVQIGGQDHFYLETQASWVQIDSEGVVQIVASTQHPTETLIIVARVLGLAAHRVVCRSLRMGGGFGGKETQANPFAAVAAVAAWHSGRAVRIKLPRSLDMQLTGKRHPFLARYELAADRNGQLLGARVELVADGGWSCDLSPPVLSRAMVHVDNAYYFPVLEVNGRIARTHLPSNTAFRGFGGPQGIFVAEEMLSHLARHLGLAPEQVPTTPTPTATASATPVRPRPARARPRPGRASTTTTATMAKTPSHRPAPSCATASTTTAPRPATATPRAAPTSRSKIPRPPTATTRCTSTSTRPARGPRTAMIWPANPAHTSR